MNRQETQTAIGTNVRYAIVGAVCIYFLLLSLLTCDTVQEGDLFTTELDRLTDTYLAYLGPQGELRTPSEARRWLRTALADLRPREQENLLIAETETWIDILGALPQDATVRLDRVRSEENEASFAFLMVPGVDMLPPIRQRNPSKYRQEVAAYLKLTRPALQAYLDQVTKHGKLANYFRNFNANDNDLFYRTACFVLAIGFQKSLYLSGIAPLWEEPFDIQKAMAEGTPVPTVIAEMKKKLDQLKQETIPSKFMTQGQALLDRLGQEAVDQEKLLSEVNDVRKYIAPEAAVKRLRFFGPLCVRRLTTGLLSDDEIVRLQVWELTLDITRLPIARIPLLAKYKPQKQPNEDTQKGRDEEREKRKEAVKTLLSIFDNLRSGTGVLEPGLENMY